LCTISSIVSHVSRLPLSVTKEAMPVSKIVRVPT